MMKAKSLLVFVLACALLVAGCSAVPPNSDMPEAVPSTGLPSTCTPSAANPPMDYTLYGGDILRVGSQGYEKCRINADTAQKYAGLISDAADALAGETQVYCLIIPTSYGILLPDEVKSFRVRELFNRFMMLMERDYKVSRDVYYYTGQMNITSKYLTNIVRQVTGHTPKIIIDQYVILHIKMQLQHSSLSIKEIAWDYHFTDISFFCRYFKKHTGKTPQQLREKETFRV